MSCFTGSYVTGTVNQEFLSWVEMNINLSRESNLVENNSLNTRLCLILKNQLKNLFYYI